jgi:hypothetical protein
VLEREHAPDADEVSENAAMVEMVRSAGEAAEAVTSEEAQAYLGDYGHGVRVRFAEQGFVLSAAAPRVAGSSPQRQSS